jgi:methyltransferase (TIGR00027 family)
MRDGIASHTARSVAARRLEFERLPADFGDPEADLALSEDVAAGLQPSPGRMHEYIRARTAFFDRVVVRAINAGIRQVVVGAAGYDARSLRYAKPGVHWFEVDHPATQADKLERLARLGIEAGHVRFVAADFTRDSVADRLRAAGLDDRRPALFLFEGIVVYLEEEVTESVLAQFREVTVAGSTLAISVSTASAGQREAGHADDARAVFRAGVAQLGEPARSVLEPAEAEALLARAGWTVAGPPGEGSAEEAARASGGTGGRPPEGQLERQRAAGLLIARAVGSERHLPLHALLSRALVAFTIEADNEAEHRLPNRTTSYGRSPGSAPDAPWLISLAMWASSLRLVPDDGITVAELRRAARTGSNLAGLRRWGYLTFDPEPARGKQPDRDAVIRLTVNGRRARDGWAPVGALIEERWRERFGTEAVSGLRSALEAVVARLPAGLPDSLPILGYGLFSRGSAEALPEAGASPEASAPSLETSAPTPQAGAVSPEAPWPEAAGLPLWALLSRALLAFAAEYEAMSPVSLAICGNVLRVLRQDGVRSRDIPDLAGVSKEAVAMAMGILVKRGLAIEGRDPAGGRWRIARLTPRGAFAQAAYHELAADVEDAWRERFAAGPPGAPAVTTLRAALERLPVRQLLEGTEPYPEGWRARMAAPTVLPHYPMVLHRGAYPDGS